ncbi:FAR1-related sequence 3 [Actinidia rufa]|uniref:FAR1-related sequence 3 n=1 Tax=Actinidia rufa TaxID=165716 RepID=A0A7J0FL05_9ERIC|nr:FAR1-related sequence 3 [Actinidia rufa]
MSQLLSPLSLTSPESVPSTMCPMSSQVEWDEKVESWSVDIGEEEEEVLNDSIMKDCVDGKEIFKKGKDGMLKHVILQCSRGGKPRPRGSNPAKARPQCKVDCPAHLNVIRTKEGKWRLVDLIRFHICQGIAEIIWTSFDVYNLPKGMLKQCIVIFMRMRGDNADFFYAMDLNEKGRLRNVFWADARSREACKEFGDVVTFDTTYLVNKYDMPFAPFVGVNHHGQSILLGCGLISHEDTESFSWLFQTWLECMWGGAPKAIITDQCQAMRNAIQNIFPDTRHRWCIWHIMKKVPEKLSGYEAYQIISYHFRQVVYDSLTKEEFEKAWDVFMEKYDFQSNTWLHGLYLEKERWVPAYVKDMFWAGMSSTQRSENMQSWYTFIPCMTNDDLEKQFQSAYTNSQFAHFRDEFIGKMACSLGGFQVGHVWTEYEVKESITVGEREELQQKCVSFKVDFNAETNEAQCICRLFECKGMICKHQLFVYQLRGIHKVPDKYVLKRWCKNVKRVHTKVRISYDKSSTCIQAQRNENVCNLYKEIADLVEDNQEQYDIVMARGREMKREVIEDLNVCSSNRVNDTGTPIHYFSLGDGLISSNQSTNILDPERVTRKGRPPSKRKQGAVEKAIKKKRATKKTCLTAFPLFSLFSSPWMF